jgi:thiol-disulfide isomerase/thioredoxin
MNKKLLVVGIVILLVAAVYLIDRGTRGAARPAAGSPASTSAKPVENTSAPDVTFKDLNGKEVSLSEFRGQIVLVNFWATWCGPCRFEIPSLIEFQQKYGDRGFVVLGVAMDDEGKSVVEPYITKERFDVAGKQEAINYPILLGNDAVAEKFGGIIGIPTSYLISRDGKIIKQIIGLVDHDKLAAEIGSLL